MYRISFFLPVDWWAEFQDGATVPDAEKRSTPYTDMDGTAWTITAPGHFSIVAWPISGSKQNGILIHAQLVERAGS